MNNTADISAVYFYLSTTTYQSHLYNTYSKKAAIMTTDTDTDTEKSIKNPKKTPKQRGCLSLKISSYMAWYLLLFIPLSIGGDSLSCQPTRNCNWPIIKGKLLT